MSVESYGDWKPYFAILPVICDAYNEAERDAHDGKFNWRKSGWVERRWCTWTDDDTGEVHAFWRYRECRKS